MQYLNQFCQTCKGNLGTEDVIHTECKTVWSGGRCAFIGSSSVYSLISYPGGTWCSNKLRWVTSSYCLHGVVFYQILELFLFSKHLKNWGIKRKILASYLGIRYLSFTGTRPFPFYVSWKFDFFAVFRNENWLFANNACWPQVNLLQNKLPLWNCMSITIKTFCKIGKWGRVLNLAFDDVHNFVNINPNIFQS